MLQELAIISAKQLAISKQVTPLVIIPAAAAAAVGAAPTDRDRLFHCVSKPILG